jgi:hypothetical protein
VDTASSHPISPDQCPGPFGALRKRPDLGVTGEAPTKWITRERPKIDRIACPWLVRRFIDPHAQFFYLPTPQVLEEAKLRGADTGRPDLTSQSRATQGETHNWNPASMKGRA